MASKSGNVSARVEPELKRHAESILANMGIPASTAITMYYKQIVLWNGLPFRPCVPTHRPLAVDEMTREAFDARMAEGFEQAKAGIGKPADEVFTRLIGELSNG